MNLVKNTNKIDNKEFCKNIRKKIVELIYHAQSGHIGPSLSIVEIVSSVYKEHINFNNENRNKFILSKGHAVPALYAVYDQLGLLKKNEITTLRKFGSRLQGHPDLRKLDILDAGTGALGQGLSIAIGYCLSFKLQQLSNKVFCLLGDGELQEGQIWESLMYIGVKKIKNLIVFIDGNKFQNEFSIDETLPIKNLKEKFTSFGLKYIEIDGHDYEVLSDINDDFINNKFDSPVIVYCNTIKGKGISFMENNNSYHHIKNLSQQDYYKIITEIENS
tara:strand:+ start:186 stop:1010 length:825 start_codon:yes stop_codon:yes gene_type:complete